jgi:hypothetical protein
MMRHDARTIAIVLGGVAWGGNNVSAPGPGHSRRDRSLSVKLDPNAHDGFLVFSHAGDSLADCRNHVLAKLGLTGESRYPKFRQRRSPPPAFGPADDSSRSEIALRIWNECRDPTGTLVVDYLMSRRLHLPPGPALRFHPGLPHRPTGTVWPAMVGLVSHGVTGQALGIHRTYLDRDGGAKAPVAPNKMSLGPISGGAVRLAAPANLLLVGEGCETVLSGMQVTGIPAWAAGSTSGLRGLNLPDCVRELIVLADGDAAGEAAARDCALRWTRQGRRVRIAHPPPAQDFNDLLCRHLGVSQETAP